MATPSNFWLGVAAAAVVGTVGYAIDYVVNKSAVKQALREHDEEKEQARIRRHQEQS